MKKELNDVTKSLIATFLGLLAGALLMLSIGSNPIEGFTYLLKGGTMSIERIGNTLSTATTLILTGLSVAFAFRTGLFNIGVSGQMLIGGLCATIVGLTLDFPRPVLLFIMLIAAIIGGSIWGIIPGFLKAKFNVHEVVATIMMNWIALWVVYYTVQAFLIDVQETQSAGLPAVAQLKVPWITELFQGSSINLGLVIALLAVIFIKIVLDKTTLGFELKAVGFNRNAALCNGIKVNRNIILSMMIAGGLAGLAGLTFYTGFAENMQIGILPAQGFDGIAVALLGISTPYGVLIAAIFFGILHTGKGFMSAMTDIPPQIANTIIAIIIYFTATSLLIQRFWTKILRKKKKKKNTKGGVD
ncbi:MAG: ABC transporter permease [Clostridiales bacterium]|nr:ABC transporter permease [Clostridiales bacterium]